LTQEEKDVPDLSTKKAEKFTQKNHWDKRIVDNEREAWKPEARKNGKETW